MVTESVIMGEVSDTPQVTEEEIQIAIAAPTEPDISDRYVNATNGAAKVDRPGLSRAAKVWLKVKSAQDYGITPSQAIRGLWVNPDTGAVMPTSLLLSVLVQRQPDCLFFSIIRSDKSICVWRGVKHTPFGNIDYLAEYTIDRAREEIRGFSNKVNWKNSVAMLQHRARWECAQALWPHLVMGQERKE